MRLENRPRLCFSTLGCTDLGLEAALALARRFGISAIELRGLGGELDLAEYFSATFDTPDRLAECVAEFEVAIVAMDSSVDIIGAGLAEQRELRDLLPWALAAGTPRLRVFDGGVAGDDAELRSIGDSLAWWRSVADAGGPELMIETHDALAQPDFLQRCCTEYPDAVVLWDSHHTWQEGGEGPRRTFARVRQQCPHIHVKDSESVGAARYCVPPGAGDFPTCELIATLGEDGFAGIVSLEWERHWFPELAEIEAPLAAFISAFGKLAGPMTKAAING